MKENKICINISTHSELSAVERLQLIAKCGFDGIFCTFDNLAELDTIKKAADGCGLFIQSVHGPYHKMRSVWEKTEETQAALDEITACLKATAKIGAPVMILHAYCGFFDRYEPTDFGLENLRPIIKEAKELGVRLAFENTEGEEYLAAIMEEFKDDHVVFCIDVGHEACYNPGKDMISQYGDRLFCTHLNDNLGVSDKNGRISGYDDLHLLPYDGKVDFDNVAKRLVACGYNGDLTFELKTRQIPNRHENDAYALMGVENFLKEAYRRACRFAETFEKAKQTE